MSTVAEINTIFQTAISSRFLLFGAFSCEIFFVKCPFLRLKMKVDVVDRTA